MSKTNLEWANYIIKKFGKKKAKDYAHSNYICPCQVLKMTCEGCKYNHWT